MEATQERGGDGELTQVSHALFIIVGFFYATQVLRPIPMTYLSEIAFPMDFCVKLSSSAALLSLQFLHFMTDALYGSAWHLRAPTHTTDEHLFITTLSWCVSTVLLWMEHRRSRAPSLIIRIFWMVNWIQATSELFGHERVYGLDLGTRSTFVTTIAALTYCCSAILGASCFFTATAVTSDLVDLPLVTTPSAYLHSANFKFPMSGYGTFGNIHTRLRSGGVPQSEDDPTIRSGVSLSRASSHSAARGESITATIPTCTTSIWAQHRFISFKIVVQTEDDQWTVRRQYSDFASLFHELPAAVKDACPLPQDGSEQTTLSWRGHSQPLKTKLEKFIQRVLANKAFEPYSSQALCDFLDMEYVDEAYLVSSTSGPPTGAPWSVREPDA